MPENGYRGTSYKRTASYHVCSIHTYLGKMRWSVGAHCAVRINMELTTINKCVYLAETEDVAEMKGET